MLLKEIDKPFFDDKYLYEIKFDGFRVIIYVSKEEFVIKSRQGKDVTKKYPELKSIQKLVGEKEVIFDGEIIIYKKGKMDFQELQKRAQFSSEEKIKELAQEEPVRFIAFDILYQNKDLRGLTLKRRKDILNKYKDSDFFIKSVGYLNGKELFKKIKEKKMEGIVAKLKNSKYYANKRGDEWLKIKNIKDGEFYVLGYKLNKDKYSLYLKDQNNNYVGKVSITKDNPILYKILNSKEENVKINNLKEVINYIKPTIKVTVKYLEKTREGKLRHPILK